MKKYLSLLLFYLLAGSTCIDADWQFVSPMPKGRYGHDATLGPDGKIYVMGGMVIDITEKGMGKRHDNGSYSNLVFDQIKDEWKFLEPVPGGIDRGHYKLYDEEKDFWRTVRPTKNNIKNYYEGYFPEEDFENPWKIYLTPIPLDKLRKTGVERQGDGVASVAGEDGRIYWLGGSVNSSGIGESIVLPYDPYKKTWPDAETEKVIYSSSTYGSSYSYKTIYKTDIPPMNERRIDHEAVVTSDGKIYVMGGRRMVLKPDKIGILSSTGKREATDTVECYDPATNKWEYRKPMSVKRFLFAAEVGPDDRIYTFGGTDFIDNRARKTFDLVEVYDPKIDKWSRLKPMPEPRDGHAAVLGADNKIYIMGGAISQNDPPLADVFIYNPDKDAWRKGPSLNLPRHTLAAVSTPDGKIYAIGGTDVGAYKYKKQINQFLPRSLEFYTGKIQNTVEVLDIFNK